MRHRAGNRCAAPDDGGNPALAPSAALVREEDRQGRAVDHALGRAALNEVTQARMAVRSHDEEVEIMGCRLFLQGASDAEAGRIVILNHCLDVVSSKIPRQLRG